MLNWTTRTQQAKCGHGEAAQERPPGFLNKQAQQQIQVLGGPTAQQTHLIKAAASSRALHQHHPLAE